jgi:putative membrane protein
MNCEKNGYDSINLTASEAMNGWKMIDALFAVTSLVIATLLGCGVGIITGLTPGVHINLIAALITEYSAYLLGITSPLFLGCFIIAMSITHTFLDTIPSIFLGAPDDKTALGVLPGHRYLLKGFGLMAVKLSAVGAFFGLVLSIVLFPILYYLLKKCYPFIQKYMVYLLILLACYMIIRDNKRVWAGFIFIISGLFGIAVFNSGVKDPLFPMLSGLFGVATLLVSLNESEKIPEQKIQQAIELEPKKTIIAVILGTLSSFLTSTLPGLSASIAATIAQQLYRKLGDHGFLILTGAIGTAGFSLSLVALLAIEKARNGSVAAIAALMPTTTVQVLVFLAVSCVACGIAVFLTLWIGGRFSKLMSRINYKALILGIIIFVVALCIVLSGPLGLLVMLTSTAIGLLPAIAKTTRTQAMGCLLLPVILYFL